jgi:hypothetical protein
LLDGNQHCLAFTALFLSLAQCPAAPYKAIIVSKIKWIFGALNFKNDKDFVEARQGYDVSYG